MRDEVTETQIINKIHIIRQEKVMSDQDLAELYDVETSYLKRQVRRNIERFPEDFMFELSKEEFENLRSQNGTSSWGGTRYALMAFTEQGVVQLSGVLNSTRSYPDVEKITGVFEAKNFTLNDIRAAIKEKSSESWPNIGERFHEFFIEGSDGKILIKFKDL